ncbi:MAG TPA: lipopolysaccharide heptosyltransferase II [Ktedonobacteraceae bacterium]|nr:lipopolysaccharide heptosyltransferase II [Ktedonobacteraceae bacterium]
MNQVQDREPRSNTNIHRYSLDNYGYPLPPDSRQKLRKTAVHTSKRLLNTCIYLLLSLVGGLLWLSRRVKKYPPLTPESIDPRRILVIRLDLIGDLVLSMTIVRALKHTYPDAKIDLLALPSSAQVITGDPDLNEIITYDPNVWRRPRALIQPLNWGKAYHLFSRLRAQRYDIAVSAFGQWGGILAVASGATRRVGFGKESYPGFMTDSVPGRHWHPGDHKHEVDYCLKLARAAGACTNAADRIPYLYLDPLAQEQLTQLFEHEGIVPEKPIIACHISSNNGQSKRWPIPYWATLIDKLIRGLNAQVILTGAPGDKSLIECVTQEMHEQAFNLAGKTSLPQLVALLKRANMAISGDSGPMHIAAAVGTPLIAIHGPTDPALSGPISSQATVLHSDIWCSPCYNAKDTADCRFFTTQCMKNILPSQVYQVVLDTLR